MRRYIEKILLVSLAASLTQAPLQPAQADDSEKPCGTIWQMFEPGTKKCISWRNNDSNKRFRIYEYGTLGPVDDLVWDQETGLVWQRSPSSIRQDYWGAMNFCNRSKFGGRYGWRSPTVEEAGTLLDDATTDNLPIGHPFVNIREFYWTSTTNPADPGGSNARGMDLENGVLTINWKTARGFPWCVRGGIGHEAKYSN